MLSTRRRRGLPGVRRGVLASVMAAVVAAGTTLAAVAPVEAAPICATPGGSGAGGTLTGVVNTYYPATAGSLAPGATSIPVGAPTGAATPIAAGDLLLVIQMQGADINATNTDSYGDGVAGPPASGYTALGSSGLYEYVLATSGVVAGSVSISGTGPGAGLLNSYTRAGATATAGQRTFQVVRVPQFTTATTSSGLTAAAWNGSTGGILALDTTSTLTLNGTVSVDGLGFRGGIGIQRGGGTGLSNTDIAVSSGAGAHGTKGEGAAGSPTGVTTSNGYPGGDAARGAPANAGGGGTDGRPSANDENTGGGGGGNGGAGGIGGNSWNSNLARGGYGGVAVPATSGRVLLGGGGGAGTGNNFSAPNSSGANGGGIVLIRAGSVAGAGSITANGAAAYNTTANDGGGGGGAGGSIVLTTPSGSLAGATLVANGGRGGNAWATQGGASSAHGPGGGGGGGVIITSSAPTSTSVLAGQNGITTTGNLSYGADPGQNGITATASPSSIPGASGGAECANLSITKTGPATVTAGGSLVYSLAVANAGPAAATSLSVLDTLPAGVTFVSATGTGWTCTNAGSVSVTCTRPSLASGASAPVITVTVTAPAQAGTAVNTASVSSATPDPVPSNNTSSTSTTVLASADLSIVKSGPANVTAAGTITYSLAVANAGPSNAASLTVTDTLPAGVTFVSATGTGWSCTNVGSTSVTCTRPALATATSAPAISIVVTAPAQGASLSNAATVSSSTPDPVPGNNMSTAVTTVIASADLAITKTGPATVAAGSAITYAVGVANGGPSNAASLTVTDTLPAGVTFASAGGTGWSCTNSGNVSVTCTRAALAAGASAPSIAISVTAPSQAAALTNTASVASTTADPDPANNTATAATTVTASADLSITKAGPASAVAGSAIDYTLTVANAGPSNAAGLSVTDSLPAGVTFQNASGGGWSCSNVGDVSVTCTRASLAAGSSAPAITVRVTAPASAAVLSNSASVSSATADPNPANNTAIASTTVTASADLSVVKLGPATVTASGALSYQVDVANAGPSAAVAVSMVDTLPAGVTFVSATGTGWTCSNSGDVSVTCTRPTLAAGASAPTITIVVTAPAQPASLSNTAAVTSTTADPDPSDNSSSVSTDVTGSADLSIVKSGPASVVAGATVTYQLAVANGGPSDAAAVSVADTLPAGVSFLSAAGGGWTCSNVGDVSVTCTRPGLAAGAAAPVITVQVQAPAQPTTLSNVATVASTTSDPDGSDNTSSASTAVTASADLAISKSAPATVVAGQSIAYSLVVANGGPSDAVSPTVVDTLPPGVTFVSAGGGGWTCTNVGDVSVTCTRAALAAGATAPTITVVVDVPDQAASLTNNASVSSTTPDPVAGNNAASATTTVTASADLSLVKTAPATVVAGAAFSYALLVANGGPSDAANVSVTDTLPAGVTLVAANGPGWSCSGTASVTCTRATLAAGASSTITIQVAAPDQAGSVTNTASVASTTSDPDPADNTGTATTTVTASADLSIAKAGPTTVTASGLVTYTLDVSNDGPSDAVGLTMTDALPAGVAFVSATGTGWVCTNVGDVSVTCTLPLLAAGDAAGTITVVVDAPAQAATLTNTATISSATPDPVSGNNTSSTTTTVDASADLRIAKSGPPTVSAAGDVTYTLVVVNDGPSDATDVSVTDTMPAGVTFVSADGTGWSCTNAGDVSVTCTRATLAASATAPTITVVVDAPGQAASLTNTASVTSATPDPDLSNNTSSVSTGVTAKADLSLTKTGPTSAVAGSDVTYTVDVANAGPSDAVGITVTDTLPAGATFVSADGAGWSCTNAGDVSVTCSRAALATGTAAPSISVTVTAPAQSGSLLNTASVASSTADPDTANNADSATTTITASADLSLVKTGPLTVDAGATVTYLLAAANVGPSDAVDVTVIDTLPAGVAFVSADGTGWSCTSSGDVSVTCTLPALAAGDAAPTITVVVTAPAGSATLVNRATVSSPTPDPVPANNDASATTQVAGSADLSIVKSGPANVIAGDAMTYSLLVSNAGPDAAVAVQVVDTLPAGVAVVSASGSGWACTPQGDVSVTCTRASLASGTTAPVITLVVRAPATAGSVVNTATVESATADPTPGDNSSSAPTVVVPGGGGDGGDNGDGGTPGDNPDDLPKTGATAVRDATIALILLLTGFALVLVARRRPGTSGS